MRGINSRFIEDLMTGELSFFLERVKQNSELCLEIRNGYINIYYRGGNLLRITQKKAGYSFYFDSKYCLNKENEMNHHTFKNLDNKQPGVYEANFDLMMNEMDDWFQFHPKAEREFQHNLLKTDFNIIDIEYQIKNNCRLDMLFYRENKLIIVENKFGNGAVGGNAGIAKHYHDMCDIIENDLYRVEIMNSVVNISQAKFKLGLSDLVIDRDDIEDIEILFIFADFNKRSNGIVGQMKQIEKRLEAKILFMDKSDVLINYDDAKDLFSYEHYNP